MTTSSTRMSIDWYLSQTRIGFKQKISSKKKAIENLSKLIANDCNQIQAFEVFDGMIERERLGSTGVGHGVAIPHCRLSNVVQAQLAMILLHEPINYDSFDKEPVDLIIGLITPEDATDDHLALLSMLAEQLSNDGFRSQLRACQSADELYNTFVQTWQT